MKTTWNAFWLTATRLTADVLSFLLFVAISRAFGPAGTGQYSYGFAIAGFATVFGGLGLDDFGVREYSRLPPERRRHLLAHLLGTQAAAIALAALGLAAFLRISGASHETGAVILLLSAYLLLFAAARTLFVPAFARQAMVLPALLELGCRGAAIVAALLLLVGAHAGLVAALVPFPLAGVVLVVLATFSVRRHGAELGVAASRAAIWDIARAAWAFGASEVIFQIYARADLIMLSLMVGEAAAGLYASGFKFVEVGTMPLIFAGVAAFPRLSRLYGADDGGFRDTALGLLRATLVLGGLLAWTLYYLAPALLVPILGPRFEPAVPIVRVMAALALLSGLEIAFVRILLAAHLQVWRLKLQAAGTLLNVAINAVLIPRYGVVGAIAASVVTLAMVDALYLRALRDRLPRARVLGALAALGLAAAAGLLAGEGVAHLGVAPWLAALASLAAYAAVALATGLARDFLRWPRATAGAAHAD